jgi:hypothetical protein
MQTDLCNANILLARYRRETLSARLAKGPLSIEQVLQYAIDTAYHRQRMGLLLGR